jgi:alpha,alpha-trehalase
MKHGLRSALSWLLFIVVLAARADEQLQTPQERFGELFVAVQMKQVFTDGKTFPDMVPTRPTTRILEDHLRQRTAPDFHLADFVAANFAAERRAFIDYRSIPGQSVSEHIDALWSVLTRKPDEIAVGSSLIPLPHSYVVPGGRFTEIYYWDSYFTMLGLEESGRHDLVLDMLDNFASLIDRFGHIPNGNRTYYLSRSQPPFFAAMVELAAARDGDSIYRRYSVQLEREYAFWMAGAAGLAPGTAQRRVVRLSDGTLLNRYWDDRATPRDESYREDVNTARSTTRPAEEVYRNLRAAAESGWDFSSRWFADGKNLSTVAVIDLAPIDLNSLMYNLEMTLAKAYHVTGSGDRSKALQEQAQRRKAAIQRLMWDEEFGAFVDYWWRREERSDAITAATVYPLFFGIAEPNQTRKIARRLQRSLLGPHGVVTTTVRTGEQWDAPNGWAPLQWLAIDGLRRHGEPKLAETIAQRWMHRNIQVFRETGKLLEKYDVLGDAPAGGGEYALQDGFGWTNGVLRKLLTLYPAHDKTEK